jgi:hypothetical protein
MESNPGGFFILKINLSVIDFLNNFLHFFNYFFKIAVLKKLVKKYFISLERIDISI